MKQANKSSYIDTMQGQVGHHKRFLEHFQHKDDDDNDDKLEKGATSRSQKPGTSPSFCHAETDCGSAVRESQPLDPHLPRL